MGKRFAILASGAGTTVDFLLTAQEQKKLDPQLILVITNNPEAGVIAVAQRFGVRVEILKGESNKKGRWDEQILKFCREANIDFIFLAGFLKKIGPDVIHYFSGQIFNSHPSLLPKYGGKGMYGRRVTEAVLEGKETETGVTIHAIDHDYDRGKILVQKTVPITPEDDIESLINKVKIEEKHAILKFLNSRV